MIHGLETFIAELNAHQMSACAGNLHAQPQSGHSRPNIVNLKVIENLTWPTILPVYYLTQTIMEFNLLPPNRNLFGQCTRNGESQVIKIPYHRLTRAILAIY